MSERIDFQFGWNSPGEYAKLWHWFAFVTEFWPKEGVHVISFVFLGLYLSLGFVETDDDAS